MQIELGTMGQMMAYDFVTCSPTITEVKHFGLKTMTGAAFGNLKDNLLDSSHCFRVIGLEKVKDLTHQP
ncbi:hypothetical protein BK636_00470 [Pseudomonas chlororaphis]|nr:hypothetical protein BK636_00470 [Pseudomonas chlororaphis]